MISEKLVLSLVAFISGLLLLVTTIPVFDTVSNSPAFSATVSCSYITFTIILIWCARWRSVRSLNKTMYSLYAFFFLFAGVASFITNPQDRSSAAMNVLIAVTLFVKDSRTNRGEQLGYIRK